MAVFEQNDLKDKKWSNNFSLVDAFGEYIVNTMKQNDDKSLFLIYTEGSQTACVIGGGLKSISTAIYNGVKEHEAVHDIIEPVAQAMAREKLDSILEKYKKKRDEYGDTED